MIATATHVDPMNVRSRLSELGLAEKMLLLAVERGQIARLSCTKNHPPLYPGISAWSETVCALREQLIPEGWERSDEGNLPFTVNPGRTVAIAVATGDEATGRTDRKPCTKSAKRPRTAGAVATNERQMLLFGPLELRPEHLTKINERMTWLLLIHSDFEVREVRCELSRPVNMNEEGRVDDWAERIILSASSFDADVAAVPSGNVPQSPEIIVKIKKRA